MAHFAKIGTGNIVEQVVVVDNSIATNEQNGIQFLKNLYNDPNAIWVQTSYNTRNGVHLEGGTPLREDVAVQDLELSNHILKHAPKSEDGYFVVPKIIE